MSGRPTSSSDAQRETRTRVAYVLFLCLALTLLAIALGAGFYGGLRSSVLLVLILLALGAAMGLIGRSLFVVRRQHRDAATALDMTERTYKSVFDSALDGILILDDVGKCLEANPAALALLGSDRRALMGRSIEGFFRGDANGSVAWKRPPEERSGHVERQVYRPDSSTRIVEFTARANFLPGRHVVVLRDITRKKEAELALRESEERFQQMADNIQEIFWMVDVPTAKILYLSPAYKTITGRERRSFIEDPKSHQEALHPEDRVRILSRLDQCLRGEQLDEEFRIISPDSAIRWVWGRTFAVTDSFGKVRRIVGTAQDVTARKCAEEQIARSYDLAEAARAEAEAFRKTSLALTRNLSMDSVLDTLLQALLKLVPCSSAQVILAETDSRLFLAREVANCKPEHRCGCPPETFDARDSRFLAQVLTTKKSLIVPDTTKEPDWERFDGFSHLQSWLCVPLVASRQVLGVLSLGDTNPHAFTREHLRLARSLAIPAAVAIQNARLYEQAEILRLELEQRLTDLERAERALGRARGMGLPQ